MAWQGISNNLCSVLTGTAISIKRSKDLLKEIAYNELQIFAQQMVKRTLSVAAGSHSSDCGMLQGGAFNTSKHLRAYIKLA